MVTIKRMLAAVLCVMLLFGATAWAEGHTVYTGTDNARVYDISGNAVGTLPADTELQLLAVKGRVCQVSYRGKTGYMDKADLVKATAAQTESQAQVSVTAYVSRDGAKVYDKSGDVIGQLGLNTEVTVTAAKGNVCQISVGGRTGYMKKSDLSKNRVAEAQVESVNKTAYVNKDGAKVYNSKGKAVGSLDLNTEVTVTAVNGKICKISVGGRTGYMSADDLSSKKAGQPEESHEATGASTVKPATGTAKEMDWWTSGIQTIFAKGTTATITDVETGLAWREQRRGGTNHADVQPLTAADTAVLKQAYGGTWSWTRRAIFVTIDGVNYAASMNGMPHGGGSITDNDFNGHHCIHFTNSRTHGSNRVCELHQAAIRKALAARL